MTITVEDALTTTTNPVYYCEPDDQRGVMNIVGNGFPDGDYRILRLNTKGTSEELRGGWQELSLGAFSRQDTEVPFGVPVAYMTELQPVDRHIQTNWMLTPNFHHGKQGWVAGANRTLNIVTDSTFPSTAAIRPPLVANVTANPTGGSQGVAGRTIAEGVFATTIPVGPAQITGKVRFYTSNIQRWLDVRSNPPKTWADVKALGSWETVRGAAATLPRFGSLYISISAGAVNYVAPIVVIDPTTSEMGQWFTFVANLTIPAGLPAGARVRLLHGTGPYEYTAQWWFSEIGLQTAADSVPARMLYFDGDTPLPINPTLNVWPNGVFSPGSNDASIRWSGTIGASTSIYTLPSTITSKTACQIDVPDNGSVAVGCQPVNLGDPIQSRLGQWYGLLGISDLTYAGRLTLHDILRRSPQIAVTDVRAWETGELRLLTATLDERRMAIQTLQTGRILMLRNPDPLIPEGNDGGTWYLAIGTVTEKRLFKDHRRPEREWGLPFVRVERPVGLIEASSSTSVTWATVKATNASWATVAASYADWLDVMLRDKNQDPTGGSVPPVASRPSGALPTNEAFEAWSGGDLP